MVFRKLFSSILLIALCLYLAGCSTARKSTSSIPGEESRKRASQAKTSADIQTELTDLIERMKSESVKQDVSAHKIIPLPLNEVLVYKVKWAGMTVGTINIQIKSLENYNDRPVYVIEATAQTSGFFKVYPVHDRFVSYMDAEHLHVLRQEVYRREGRYKKDAIVEFDQTQGHAYFKHLFNGTSKDFPIPAGVQDSLTTVYYLQTREFKAGDELSFMIYADEKSYEVRGHVEDHEPIKVSGLGKLPAYFIKPLARFNNEEVKDGSAQLYLSADGRKIPIRAVVNGPIFSSISLVLDHIKY